MPVEETTAQDWAAIEVEPQGAYHGEVKRLELAINELNEHIVAMRTRLAPFLGEADEGGCRSDSRTHSAPAVDRLIQLQYRVDRIGDDVKDILARLAL